MHGFMAALLMLLFILAGILYQCLMRLAQVGGEGSKLANWLTVSRVVGWLVRVGREGSKLSNRLVGWSVSWLVVRKARAARWQMTPCMMTSLLFDPGHINDTRYARRWTVDLGSGAILSTRHRHCASAATHHAATQNAECSIQTVARLLPLRAASTVAMDSAGSTEQKQQYDYDIFTIGAGSCGVRGSRIASSYGV